MLQIVLVLVQLPYITNSYMYHEKCKNCSFFEKLKPIGGPKSGYHQLDDFSNTIVCVSAGKKSFCPPLWVQDGQGVSDIGRNTYANLMTPTGNKNCQPLWLFRVEPALVSSTCVAAAVLAGCPLMMILCFKLFLANFLSHFWKGNQKQLSRSGAYNITGRNLLVSDSS